MTDNGSPADANAASEPVEEFPSKLRVHALARFLGLTSRQVLAHLANLGVQTRSPQSSVDRELAKAVADRVRAEAEPDEAAAEAPVADQPVAEQPVAEQQAEAPAAEEPPTEESAAEAPVAEEPATAPSEPSPPEPTHDEPPTLFSAAATPAPYRADDAPAPADIQPLFLPPQSPAERPAERSRSRRGDAGSRKQPKSAESADDQQLRTDSPSDEAATQPATAEAAATDTAATDTAATDTVRTDSRDTGDARDSDDTDSHHTDSGDTDTGDESSDDSGSGRSRRRRRGRRGRGRGRGEAGDNGSDSDSSDSDTGDDDNDTDEAVSSDAAGDESDNRHGGEAGTQDSGSPHSDSDSATDTDTDSSADDESETGRPAGKRRRRTRRAGGSSSTEAGDDTSDTDSDSERTASDDSDTEGSDDDTSDQDSSDGEMSSTRRRRRRRRRRGGGEPDESSPDDPPNTVVHEREPRSKRARDEVQGISGSTRLEAKRQRRRDGRDAGRRRPPILTESEFLARREAVDRVMVVRERSANSSISVRNAESAAGHDHAPVEDYTQVAVLEDGVLVEHFVTTETSSSMVGNIYLGRVQNVLPGMEAAFVDIGRGRNGVLYAGEVNWDAAGLDGGSRKIEQALKPGDNVLVQVSKDPVGHKGARLTTQISLAGRYLVYVPGGTSTGISRKLPDVERKRLKQILAKLVPDEAGVIIRTASEGVSADELAADIERLEGQWKTIEEAVAEAKKGGSSAPKPLYEEPDLLVRVVRDLFNEDFKKLVVEGDKAWNLVEGYVSSVAPDLMERVEKFSRPHADAPDSFVVHRIDEQLAKALDRKVWLPSGGTLIIEHTEAMTVVDVNTGKFTGSGGNLEETVTRNNLEAAEEIVRQMRLRDIGGMIIVDFIDMVLESNRDLVLRRLTEALARDRTRHQVSEVTSLGLVQMTRKRLGTGLLEAFSTPCTSCGGRGLIVHANPVEVKSDESRSDSSGSKRSRRSKKKADTAPETKPATPHKPAAEHPLFRAMAAHTSEGEDSVDDLEISQGTPDGAAPDAADKPEPKADDKPEPKADDKPEPKADDKPEPKADDKPEPKADDKPEREPEPQAKKKPDEKADPIAAEAVDAGSDGQAAPAAEQRRRRRVVRRPVQATTAPENVVMTATEVVPQTPTTSFGPMSAGTGESAVAVRRRPRRRTAGRPAGPPPADD